MQDGRKAVWSIPYVSVASFFQSLKQNFIVYRSSKESSRSVCIFEIQQLWQSGFSRVYSNCCCSCSFEPEIIKISQSSHKMYSNNILDFQESTTILNACTKSKSGNLLNAPRIYIYIYTRTCTRIYIYEKAHFTQVLPQQLAGNSCIFGDKICRSPAALRRYLRMPGGNVNDKNSYLAFHICDRACKNELGIRSHTHFHGYF